MYACRLHVHVHVHVQGCTVYTCVSACVCVLACVAQHLVHTAYAPWLYACIHACYICVLYMRAYHVGEGDLGRDETVEGELRDLGGGR